MEPPLRKKVPTTLPMVAGHTERWGRRRSTNQASRGTMGTYSAVRKLAFDTEVLIRPICCKIAPRNSRVPRPTQDSTSRPCTRTPWAVTRAYSRQASGTTNSAPIKKRAAVNVNGPTSFMPSCWATKVVPQISAVISIRPLEAVLFTYVRCAPF